MVGWVDCADWRRGIGVRDWVVGVDGGGAVLFRVERGIGCNTLLAVVIHDSRIEALHLGLGLGFVVVEDALIEGARAVNYRTDGDGAVATPVVAILDVLLFSEELLPPAGNALGGADGRRRTQNGVLGPTGDQLQVEGLWRVLGLATHSSADSEEEEAPDENGGDVGGDYAADLGGQKVFVSGGVGGGRGTVLRQGRGVVVIVDEVVRMGLWRRSHKGSKQEQKCRREVSESPPHCWSYHLSQP